MTPDNIFIILFPGLPEVSVPSSSSHVGAYVLSSRIVSEDCIVLISKTRFV